jgi:hypothetical protein
MWQKCMRRNQRNDWEHITMINSDLQQKIETELEAAWKQDKDIGFGKYLLQKYYSNERNIRIGEHKFTLEKVIPVFDGTKYRCRLNFQYSNNIGHIGIHETDVSCSSNKNIGSAMLVFENNMHVRFKFSYNVWPNQLTSKLKYPNDEREIFSDYYISKLHQELEIITKAKDLELGELKELDTNKIQERKIVTSLLARSLAVYSPSYDTPDDTNITKLGNNVIRFPLRTRKK